MDRNSSQIWRDVASATILLLNGHKPKTQRDRAIDLVVELARRMTRSKITEKLVLESGSVKLIAGPGCNQVYFMVWAESPLDDAEVILSRHACKHFNLECQWLDYQACCVMSGEEAIRIAGEVSA